MKIHVRKRIPLRCRLNIHKWSKKTFTSDVSSNVRDWRQHCILCDKKRKGISIK